MVTLLTEVIDIHLDTGLEHDIEHADLAERLNGMNAGQDFKPPGTHDDSRNDESHNAGDANLPADHRHQEDDRQDKGNNG